MARMLRIGGAGFRNHLNLALRKDIRPDLGTNVPHVPAKIYVEEILDFDCYFMIRNGFQMNLICVMDGQFMRQRAIPHNEVFTEIAVENYWRLQINAVGNAYLPRQGHNDNFLMVELEPTLAGLRADSPNLKLYLPPNFLQDHTQAQMVSFAIMYGIIKTLNGTFGNNPEGQALVQVLHPEATIHYWQVRANEAPARRVQIRLLHENSSEDSDEPEPEQAAIQE